MGERPGLTKDERERLKTLKRENRELKRANEVLRKASAFFAAAELDRFTRIVTNRKARVVIPVSRISAVTRASATS